MRHASDPSIETRAGPDCREPVIRTTRLSLRELSPDDADFIVELVNQPSWLRFIGDRNVRSIADAREFLRTGPIAMYARHGHGLWRVGRREDDAAMGLCGLLRREGLADPDIGFAFLPDYWGRGYALEAAQATVEFGQRVLHLDRIVAIVAPDNAASIGLLSRLGFAFEQAITLATDAPTVDLYALGRSQGKPRE